MLIPIILVYTGWAYWVFRGKVADDGSVRKLEVKAGDRILFGKYSGTEVKIDGTEYLVMREEDIMGVVE